MNTNQMYVDSDKHCTKMTFHSPLKTKRRLLYLKAQFVPRCIYFISVIKTSQFML